MIPVTRLLSRNAMKSFSTLCLGSKVTECRTLSKEHIEAFAQLTGDYNSVHFGDNGIVHGVLLNGLVSSVLGTKLPGPGYIVVEQSMTFPSPCFAGQTVEIQVEIVRARKIVECSYVCTNVANKKIVHQGIAKLVKLSKS
jgi:acyl dehydratase